MSLVGILHFALKSLDVLSWPFFALGYPLFASIRAIEKNSSSDTQKLVTYWIAFSLILLFENAFLKLLERLWLWPHMKLMIICWLVVPHFDGAVYVYNHLLRPCLSMNPLVIIHEFNRWKEFLLKRDDFLAEAERYIKENGTEALEELIATKSNSKEPNIVQKDSKAVEVTEKKEVPAAKRVVPAEPNLEQTENTTSATKEIEGPTVAVERTRELPDIPMPKEVQKEWTCDICELTVESDKVLNSHLQGKKHEATYEALKAKNQPNIIPASTAEETEQPVEEPQNNVTAKVLIQKTITNHEEKQQGQPTSISTSSAKKSDQPMREEAEKGVSNSELEQKKQAVEVTEKNEVPAAKRVVPAEPNLEQTVNTTSAMPKEGLTVAVATTRELPDIPMPKEVQKEWTCDICQLTVACEKILNSHLQGKKHKTALKAKDQPTVEEPQKSVSSKELKQRIVTKYEEKQQGQQTIASASTATKSNQPTKEESEKRVSNSELEQKEEAVGVKDSTLRCNICNINCNGENNLVSHFNGRKHLARIRLMIESVGSGQV